MATSASKAAPKSGLKAVAAEGDADVKQSKFKIILIALIAVLVLLASAGGAAWYFLVRPAQHGAPAKEVQKPPVFMNLEMFTVNLLSEETQQFLQVSMTLQVSDDAQIDLLRLHMPQVRNRLLLLLSGKKAADILTPEGKKKLTSEIVAQLQQPFAPKGPGPEVLDVFFTSFVVQ